MSKHIEFKVNPDGDGGRGTVNVKTFYRRYPPNGPVIQPSIRQWTVPLAEFERALNDAKIEIPWRGLL